MAKKKFRCAIFKALYITISNSLLRLKQQLNWDSRFFENKYLTSAVNFPTTAVCSNDKFVGDPFVLFCLWEMAWYEATATAKEYPIISEVYPNRHEWLSGRTPLPQDFGLVTRTHPGGINP
jgi:hypothetical protein